MRILLIDILRTILDEVWPSVEHSLGLMYLSSSLKKEFGDSIDIRIRTLISKPNPGTELYKLAQSLGCFRAEGYNVLRDYVQVGDGPYSYSLDRLTELKKKAIREFAFTRARIANALRILPGYFTPREIDGFFMAYVVSSKAKIEEIEDEEVKRILHRCFLVAERFSKVREFYV